MNIFANHRANEKHAASAVLQPLWRTAGVLCVCASLGACASSLWTPDARLGQAVRQAQQVQTIDPYAALREPEQTGSDGAVAKAAIDRYQKSYETLPPPVNVLNIGVGTGMGSAGVR